MKTEFGFTLPQRGVFFGVMTMPELIEAAVEADRSELFSSVWVGDSLTAKPRPDSLSLLGSLAAATERVKLGVGCMASFPIRDPILFAYQWATLDQLSSGRNLLAVCTGIVAGGASAKEGSLYSVPDPERARRMEENIDICRKLWSSNNVSFEGKFTSFDDLTIEPRPLQDPCPIWIAANPSKGPSYERALRRVATKSDGWMTAHLFPGMFAGAWSHIQTYLRERGRDPESFPTAAYHNININEDRDAALQESKRFLDEYYGPVFTPSMVESWTAAGTPAQCVENLKELIRGGAKTITLRILSWDQREQFKRMINEVLPLVVET